MDQLHPMSVNNILVLSILPSDFFCLWLKKDPPSFSLPAFQPSDFTSYLQLLCAFLTSNGALSATDVLARAMWDRRQGTKPISRFNTEQDDKARAITDSEQRQCTTANEYLLGHYHRTGNANVCTDINACLWVCLSASFKEQYSLSSGWK